MKRTYAGVIGLAGGLLGAACSSNTSAGPSGDVVADSDSGAETGSMPDARADSGKEAGAGSSGSGSSGSGSGSGSSGSGSSGSGSGSSGSGSSGSGSSGSGSSGSGSGSGSGGTDVGYARITFNDATDFDHYSVTADVGLGQSYANACMAAPIQGCCNISTIGFVDVAANMGTLTIDDGSGLLATMNPSGADETYPAIDSQSGSSIQWAPGDVLKLTATGGDIPAYSGSIVAPGPVTGFVPPIDSTATDQSLAQDLKIQWTPDPNSTTFTVQLDTGESTIILCQVPEAQGSIVVDHSLYAGAGIFSFSMASLTAINENAVTINAAGSPVTVVAQSQIGGTVALQFTP